MFSRHDRSIRRGGSERRGSVLILVVGVLAMLFVIGASQLMVARFAKQTAEQNATARNAEQVAGFSVVPQAQSIRSDIAVVANAAYSGGWDGQGIVNTSAGDASDFPGRANFPSNTSSPEYLQAFARTGDLLPSSLEPYQVAPNGIYRLFAISWSQDHLTADMNPANAPANNSFEVKPAGPISDADGDGLSDSINLGAALTGPVGGSYQGFQRVLPHGGMVMLDSMTHPALLAQVIHPQDLSTVQGDPTRLFLKWVKQDNDEARLRRRFMLPGSIAPSTDEWNALPSTDLRRILPFTLGYASPVSTFSNMTPHWWPVSSNTSQESAWWKARITPSTALTEATAAERNNSMYDRQHLLTTKNYDDLLRPIRDERRLLELPNTSWNTFVKNAEQGPLYYVLNPQGLAGTDGYGNEKQGRFVAGGFPCAYGMVNTGASYSLLFNVPGLRTPFSLRDVLGASGTPTAQRLVQLTAYYLAMIQHTTVPGTSNNNAFNPDHSWIAGSINPTPAELISQIRMAAQLAVNTVDFADADTNPTYFEYDVYGDASQVVKVLGIEKQPFITEAYAKVVRKKVALAAAETDDTSCRFAVEIYNPYDVPLVLDEYLINDTLISAATKTDGSDWKDATSGKYLIPAHDYLVFVNATGDPTNNKDGAGKNPPFDPFTDTRIRVMSTLKLSDHLKAGDGKSHVQLKRNIRDDNNVLKLDRNGAMSNTSTVTQTVVVDSMGKAPGLSSNDNIQDVELGALPVLDPGDGGLTVRHTSLQRRKEPDPIHPVEWRFTVGVQKAMDTNDLVSSPTDPATLTPDQFAATDIHGLLDTPDKVALSDLLCVIGATGCATAEEAMRFQELAPMPIITSDAGMDPNTLSLTAGCAAFPTTGTLLLVTRDGHLSFNGTETASIPLTTFAGSGSDGAAGTVSADDRAALSLIDHGHMPVFDGKQACTDLTGWGQGDKLPQGRFDLPWGQMVFSYFTALPLEELTVNSLWGAPDLASYQTTYNAIFGTTVPDAGTRVPGYPLVDREAAASSPYGPRVRGRINVNYAPWWVLDGLPALPDAVPPTYVAALKTALTPYAETPPIPANSTSIQAGLPVAELLSKRLDPFDYGTTSAAVRVGQVLMRGAFDDTTAKASVTDGFPTVGPEFARYMVSYRENRPVVDRTNLIDANNDNGQPGFLTVGAIANVVPNIPMPVTYNNVPVTYGGSSPLLWQLRACPDPTVSTPTRATLRPYHYLGYLQMIAPIVRLQDWATTKSHVYTMYSLIGSGNVWLRSQTTIDRTRCLYTNDLPERLVQTEAIDYFDAVGDQQ